MTETTQRIRETIDAIFESLTPQGNIDELKPRMEYLKGADPKDFQESYTQEEMEYKVGCGMLRHGIIFCSVSPRYPSLELKGKDPLEYQKQVSIALLGYLNLIKETARIGRSHFDTAHRLGLLK